jgi:predicted DNA-binding transcriptional regulator YafY
LRIDDNRYCTADLFPIDGEWHEQGRDELLVTIEFKNGLAWGYEGHPDDISDSGPGTTRQITRKCDSTYWLWQDLSRHGSSAKVLSPESVRERIKAQVQAMMAQY